MFVEKNGEVYAVKESKVSWTIIAPSLYGDETVTFCVRKVDCGTIDALKNFIWANSAF
ncbi:MAG: hypothetical protein J6B79_02105 [Clostridia bacterium]|nr:hypothetical protein [Clostridia bacterium]